MDEVFTVWTIESPPEQTVVVDTIQNLGQHVVSLAMYQCKPGDIITITASEMCREEWENLPEFEGA